MQVTLHSAIDKVFNWNNLKKASKHVQSNKGCGGVDGMSVEAWGRNEETHLQELRRRLRNDTYKSKPALRRYIEKLGSRKKRPLGIPAVGDRVCQQAVCQVLEPVFEQYFHASSHAYRGGRSTHTAMREVLALRKQGYGYVVELDIASFFDRVSHEVTMRLVKRIVKDRRVLGLIHGWLKAGVMEEGKVRYEVSGTPQGGVISPLLSNLYLTELDNALSQAGYRFVRYADDVVILCRCPQDCGEALALVRQVLSRLKLELNEEKTNIGSFRDGFDFLGFHFTSRHVKVASKSMRAFYRKVREHTRRRQGNRTEQQVIATLTPILRGWANYHRHGNNAGLFKRLDKWVRKRLRSYIHGRWAAPWGQPHLVPSPEHFHAQGLCSLHSISRAEPLQLELF